MLFSQKQIASPGWMHETSAQGWYTGMSQRDGMGREVGGGIGMGNFVHPWLIHVNVWQKPLQYCKVISLQLIKIKEKNKIQEITWKKREKIILWNPLSLDFRQLLESTSSYGPLSMYSKFSHDFGLCWTWRSCILGLERKLASY